MENHVAGGTPADQARVEEARRRLGAALDRAKNPTSAVAAVVAAALAALNYASRTGEGIGRALSATAGALVALEAE